MKQFIIKYLSRLYVLHNLYIKHKYYLKKKSYSDSGEDLYILDNFDKEGFYVDVGCHHPTRFNNCHLLYLNTFQYHNPQMLIFPTAWAPTPFPNYWGGKLDYE